jgi:phosphoribosylamine--glycine ligase
VLVIHAGTTLEDGKLYTSGGRVLNVVALGDNLEDARRKAYAAVDKIHFEGCHFRTDIGTFGTDH